MKKIRSIVCAFIALISCFAICFAFAACSDEEGETVKYDLAIRVSCSDGTMYEFPVGTLSLNDEITFDDEKRTYEVYSYNRYGDPEYGNLWINPNFGNFYVKLYCKDESGYYNSEVDYIENQGSYQIRITADYSWCSSRDINYTHWSLYVEIN